MAAELGSSGHMCNDPHLLVAKLHRGALLQVHAAVSGHTQGLSQGGKLLRLSPAWRRRLRQWDACLGLVEKISEITVHAWLGRLQEELQSVAATAKGKGDPGAKQHQDLAKGADTVIDIETTMDDKEIEGEEEHGAVPTKASCDTLAELLRGQEVAQEKAAQAAVAQEPVEEKPQRNKDPAMDHERVAKAAAAAEPATEGKAAETEAAEQQNKHCSKKEHGSKQGCGTGVFPYKDDP